MPKDYVCSICDHAGTALLLHQILLAYARGLFDVRLCEDGNYYCRPCRESCDLQAQFGGKNSNW